MEIMGGEHDVSPFQQCQPAARVNRVCLGVGLDAERVFRLTGEAMLDEHERSSLPGPHVFRNRENAIGVHAIVQPDGEAVRRQFIVVIEAYAARVERSVSCRITADAVEIFLQLRLRPFPVVFD